MTTDIKTQYYSPKYVVIGAGGLALEVVTYISKQAGSVAYLMSDRETDLGFWDIPVVPIAELQEENVKYICAIGSAKAKQQIIENLNIVDEKWHNIYMEQFSGYENKTGVGTVLCPGVSITSKTTIGKHVLVNLNCTIGHDSIIGDYTTLYPDVNISGNVKIGKCCELGTNSVVLPGVTIGDNCIVGAGAVVTKDLPDNSLAVGIPAKIIKTL